MEGALAHQPGGGGVPEGGRAAVAERDLIAIGQAEQLAEARAHPADQVADRRLAVRGSHQRGLLGEPGQRLRADLRGPAAEAPVGGLQLGRDLGGEAVVGRHRAGDRLLTARVDLGLLVLRSVSYMHTSGDMRPAA